MKNMLLVSGVSLVLMTVGTRGDDGAGAPPQSGLHLAADDAKLSFGPDSGARLQPAQLHARTHMLFMLC